MDSWGANFLGLVDREIFCKRDLFNGGKGDFLAAAAGAVGLGDDGENLEVRLREEVFESGNGELGCAAEE
jgi:hypothetical protein